MNSKLREFQKKIWFRVSKITYKMSPVFASKLLFFFAMKKRLNLKNPKTFNEKIQWLKLYWQDERVAQCADKYDVRKYVEEKGLEETLNPIYGVYTKDTDIDFSILPKKFALKGTHGCGYNLICKDKDSLNKQEALKLANEWLNSNYCYTAAEIQYENIMPKIIIEKFIDGVQGAVANDYKIFCFNGKPHFTMVCEDRGIDGRPKYYFYDNNWDMLPYNANSKEVISSGSDYKSIMPVSFADMLKYAEILSEEFPFVRVDFYEVEGKPILGEMTFTPCGGIDSRLDKDVDEMMGDLINLPEKYIKSGGV